MSTWSTALHAPLDEKREPLGRYAKAFLAGASLWPLLLLPAITQSTPEYLDPPSEIHTDAPETNLPDAGQSMPKRRHY